MKQNLLHLFTILLLSLLFACASHDQKLDTAYEVYKSNLDGIELYKDLSKEQKLLLSKHMKEGYPTTNVILDWFQGKVNLSQVSANTHKATKYNIPENLFPQNISYSELMEQKDSLDKSYVEYNREGSPILIDSTIVEYENGKVTQYGNKKYTYTDNETIISYRDNKEDKTFVDRLVFNDRELTMMKYTDDVFNGNSTHVKFTDALQRKETISSINWGSISNPNLRVNHLFFEYNSLGHLTRCLTKLSKTKNGTTEDPIVSSDVDFTYYKSGIRKSATNSIKDAYGNSKYKYYYNFFKDQDGLLNVYILKCPPFAGPKTGMLGHYIFDDYSNLLYYRFDNYNNDRSYSYFKEYVYFD